MDRNYYSHINELIEEVNALGDWKKESERDNYFKVLSKITLVYNCYREGLDHEIIESMVEACKGKFPLKQDVFDQTTQKVKEGLPQYVMYYPLVDSISGIALLAERTNIEKYAEKLGIDVHDKEIPKEDIKTFVDSSRDYVRKGKEYNKTDIKKR